MPTILFLTKFVGIYVVGNFLYGVYVTKYEPAPDPVTHWVTKQTAVVLSLGGWPSEIEDQKTRRTTNLIHDEKPILAVYEGCNGINVMIIFVAFLFAIGPYRQALVWFIPLGLSIIHLMNIIRITLLFFVAIYMRDQMYFVHKYFFTAILYIVVFILWVWWVKRYSLHKPVTA